MYLYFGMALMLPRWRGRRLCMFLYVSSWISWWL